MQSSLSEKRGGFSHVLVLIENFIAVWLLIMMTCLTALKGWKNIRRRNRGSVNFNVGPEQSTGWDKIDFAESSRAPFCSFLLGFVVSSGSTRSPVLWEPCLCLSDRKLAKLPSRRLPSMWQP